MPVATLAEVAEPLVAVHGQSDQHRLLQARAQRDALDRFGGADARRTCSARYRELYARLAATERELAEVVATARERAREADLLRFGLGEIEAVAPEPGEDAALAAEESRLGLRRHAAHRRRAGPRGALQRAGRARTPSPRSPAARGLLDGVREHDAEAGELADRLAEVAYLLSDVAADVASYAARIDTDPARLAAVSERRAALTALTRKYGESIDEVLAWAEQSATRLLDLDSTDERIERLRAERERPARRAGRRRRRAVRRAPQPPSGSAGVTAELTCWRCRTPAGRSPSDSPTVDRSPVAPVGDRGSGSRPASTRSSSCSPPTPAPSRDRCTRAPPAVSCPG